MARPKGLPKTGGRTRGTPNRTTLYLFDVCQRRKLDIWELMLNMCESLDPTISGPAIRDAMSYLYPKRKAIEISLAEMTDDEIAEELKRRLENRKLTPGNV